MKVLGIVMTCEMPPTRVLLACKTLLVSLLPSEPGSLPISPPGDLYDGLFAVFAR